VKTVRVSAVPPRKAYHPVGVMPADAPPGESGQ